MNRLVNSTSITQEQSSSNIELRLSEARFKAAITAVSGIVWTNDAAGRMKGEQQGWSKLTGQCEEEYIGYGWANAVHPDDAIPTVEAWNAAVMDKRPFKFEHRVRTTQSGWRMFSIHAIPILNQDGEIEEWVGVHTDVTEERHQKEELRRLAAELSESSYRKSEFLAVLAHELRNPLAPIRTGLDLIGMSSDNPVIVRRVREMMGRQVSHMVHLIDDLLDIARITSGKVELRRELIRLDEIIATAIEASTPILQASGHNLIISPPDETIFLDADPMRISQVLDNLLTNAAKYTPKGGTITLSAQSFGKNVTITVTDNGMGIPAEALGSVFDMFSQVSLHLARAQGGLGIGLSIVKQLIELHDGSVGVSSNGADTGSTFTVTLPRAPEFAGIAAQIPPSTRELNRVMPSLKILVADDNFDAADTLAELLRLEGHDVLVANDGRAALVKACEAVPQIIFLDIGMPGLTGYEVAQAIRSNRAYDEIILIALTGWGTEDDHLLTKKAGFDFHITKPVCLQDIEKLLQSVMEKRVNS